MIAPLLDVRDLVVRYQRLVALNGLSLSIHSGERIALLGANGSGKSTLLRVLDGLTFPDAGTFSFAGEEISAARLHNRAFTFQFRRRVGLVFQNPDVQLFNPTVFDEVAFGPLQLQWPRDTLRDRVEQMLASMHITSLRDRSPHQLSGGERKRVALASVLILDPEVVLLDEPTSALDPRSQNQIIDLVASWSGGKKTVVTATHDLDRLEEIADRCVVLEEGRLVGEGSPFQILHDVSLLERVRLISAHRHSHPGGPAGPHPHIHRHP